MNDENLKASITLQIITNQLLQNVDKQKENTDIKLKTILDSVYEKYEKVEPGYGATHCFFNQYQMISSLYTFIVLPKETMYSSMPDCIMDNELRNKWGLSNQEKDLKFKYLIRHMRNAISHGTIDFSKELVFCFTDENMQTKEIVKLFFTANDLQKFINALSYWCIKQDFELKNY